MYVDLCPSRISMLKHKQKSEQPMLQGALEAAHIDTRRRDNAPRWHLGEDEVDSVKMGVEVELGVCKKGGRAKCCDDSGSNGANQSLTRSEMARRLLAELEELFGSRTLSLLPTLKSSVPLMRLTLCVISPTESWSAVVCSEDCVSRALRPQLSRSPSLTKASVDEASRVLRMWSRMEMASWRGRSISMPIRS